MQQKPHPAILVTTLALAIAACFRASPAQEGITLSGNRQTPTSRPESWSGRPAPPRRWEQQGSLPLGYPPAGPPNDAPRPDWPGRPPSYPPGPQASPYPPPGPAAEKLERLEGPKILGRVGSEVVLASEVMPGINEMVERKKGRIPADQLEQQRQMLIQQKLEQQIETILIYLDAKQTIPAENFPHVEKNIANRFEETELKNMMKRAKAETRRELDRKLRTLGSSLERVKRAFVMRALAQSWIREQVQVDGEITYDEMLQYYRDHLSEFEEPARARWKELVARFSEYPTKSEAGAAIAEMGNRVFARVPFEQVAKANSNGITADDGGVRDWVGKGSLVSEVLDRALFELPVGQLSPILEGEKGFYIILVTERQEARRIPFREAQVQIEPKIKTERLQEQARGYVLRLREKIPVWTVFDDQLTRRPAVGRRTVAGPGSGP